MPLASLPDDAMLIILSFFKPKELVDVNLVCKHWKLLLQHNILWLQHAERIWLVQQQQDVTNNAYQTYKQMQAKYFGYAACFARVAKIWNLFHQIGTIHSYDFKLKSNAIDSTLQQIEHTYKAPLPKALALFYKLHNGQDLAHDSTVALFGFYNFYDYFAQAFLYSLEICERLGKRYQSSTSLPAYKKHVMPIIGGNGNLEISIVMQPCTHNATQLLVGQVIQSSQLHEPILLHHDCLTWIEQYAQDLHKGKYSFLQDGICRFPALQEFGSDVTTKGVRIQANALYIPEYSRLAPPATYFWSYRIRISMAMDVPPKSTCKLDSRYWHITDAKGKVDEVQGPGVIGYYPVMKPGAYFEYCSCTNLATNTGTMQGSFQFTNTETGEQFDAIVGAFQLSTLLHL